MVLPANARYGITPAPGGLELVQELLNTSPAGAARRTTDLLAGLTDAGHWSDAVSRATGRPSTPLTPRGLRRLRDLRTALRDTLHRRDGLGATAGRFDAEVDLRLDEAGAVHGTGPDLPGLILLEVFAAQAREDWPRLKLCALDVCDLAFHDRTRNTGARYHTPRCANFVNLHNSRRRRREQDDGHAR